jgi:hypothetical protein
MYVRNTRRENWSVMTTRDPAGLGRSELSERPALRVILRVHFISDVYE